MNQSTPHLTLSGLFQWFWLSKESLTVPPGYKNIYWRRSGALSLSEICLDISIKKKRPINVYLPGYFCGQSLRYLRSIQVNLIFYELDENFLPNYSLLNDLNRNENIDVFVHVHYFGQIGGQHKSRDFCDKCDAILIEDCAHIMSPGLSQKWRGDYLIFSPHKHFPLPAIALIIARDKFFLLDHYKEEQFPYWWIVKEVIKKFMKFKKTVVWKRTWSKEEQVLNISQSNKRIRGVTSSYLHNYLPKCNKRKINALNLMNVLSLIPDWSPLQDESLLECPYLLGMICQSSEIAERRFALLNQNEQLVMQWPDLPVEIIQDLHLKEQCTNLLDRTLFFFTHQQLDAPKINNQIVSIIRKPMF